MHVIDRRDNPKAKSLGNRQRFVRRVRSHVRQAVGQAIAQRKVTDLASSEKVSVSTKDINEPSFGFDRRTGKRDHVLPGNHDYQPGDRIEKPQGGASGQAGSPDGYGEDSFVFTLSQDEFLELFFEDLELPNLAAKKLRTLASTARARAGYASDGSPSRLNTLQTMRRSLARRIALRRPRADQVKAWKEELAEAEAEGDEERAKRIRDMLATLETRMRAIPFLDEVDLRYSRFERIDKPTTQAVMFCLMDTSASMTEFRKDLAKRFYMLLHLFLARHYRSVEIVFIRHTYTASEVDEETFFHGRETGGTVVSSALAEMLRIVDARYPVDDWNIYAAQASDGHNFDHDMPRTLSLLQQQVLPACQYYAYIEVGDESDFGASALWDGYSQLVNCFPHFDRAHVLDSADIYPVFHKLFASGREVA